jgi:hypothetical protein
MAALNTNGNAGIRQLTASSTFLRRLSTIGELALSTHRAVLLAGRDILDIRSACLIRAWASRARASIFMVSKFIGRPPGSG